MIRLFSRNILQLLHFEVQSLKISWLAGFPGKKENKLDFIYISQISHLFFYQNHKFTNFNLNQLQFCSVWWLAIHSQFASIENVAQSSPGAQRRRIEALRESWQD